MTTTPTELLTHLQAGQDRLEAEQAAMATTLATHTQVLRIITEQLATIIERLTPEADAGPTLQELLAALVGRVTDIDVAVRRIDRRTESMADTLRNDVVRVIQGASGANGKSDANHQANGSTAP